MIPKIILITRQDGRKGINYLLHAAKLLDDRKIKYILQIAGGGKFLQANKMIAKRLNLKNTRFLGFVKDTSDLLSKADIYVFPSVEEGSSAISILEAMRYGLPIVCTEVDGMPEDIVHNKSGILVKAQDPVVLANGMELLINNKSLAAKLGKTAKTRYYARHGKKVAEKGLEKILNS